MCTQTIQIDPVIDGKACHSCRISIPLEAVSVDPEVGSIEPEVTPLLRMLDARGSSTIDLVGQSLRVALQAVCDRPDRAGDGVLHYLKLAVEAYVDARQLTRIDPPPKGGLAPWQASLAKRLILEQMDTNISTSSLAKACNLSRGHFTRSFKQSVGVPPHRWLQERRIERAKELLASEDCALAAVAIECGFTDQAHFSRVFKIMTDYTPFSWRRIARPEASRCGAGGTRD
jgi:AraC family transcriptional regulator